MSKSVVQYELNFVFSQGYEKKFFELPENAASN